MAPRTDLPPRDPRGGAALVCAVLLIAAAVVPLDLQGHAHWEKVGWIPFVSPPIKLVDVVGNMVLFAPLGAAVAATVRLRRAVLVAALFAAAVSLCGEWLQLFSHRRFPSATDLTCNTVGAMIGAALMIRGFRAAPARASLPPRPQTEG